MGAADLLRTPAIRIAIPFLLLFALEALAHASLLRLPYYWDEAGYYIPSAWDFFRSGALIPYSTLTNAHPPGLSLYLAGAWKLFGFSPLTTRLSMCAATAAALCAVLFLCLHAFASPPKRGRWTGVWPAGAVVLLTASYPVWFAQSTLAQADTFAAVFTLWGLRYALPADKESLPLLAILFTAAALTKEIAIGTPLALAAWELVQAMRDGSGMRYRRLKRASALLCPVLPLALWFAYHRWRTGFIFGNPEYLRYNAETTSSPERILLALGHRAVHLTLHLNLFVPVLIALGSLLLPALAERPAISRAMLARIWVVLLANAVLFSVLGGALLTRYLLPMYPLVLLLSVSAIYRRFHWWSWFPALATAAFVAALLLPAPYRIAPEDTLAYRNAIVLEQKAIRVVQQRFPHSTVLTAWPVTDGLRKPELGYVRQPVPVVAVDNFSFSALQTLAKEPSAYTTAIVFSTKYEPPHLPFGLSRWDQREEERWFGLHHDLDAPAIAALLGGTVVWEAHRGPEWAAVLRFRHPQLASL